MIILDTNVISELMKPKPSAHVLAWVAKQPIEDVFATSISEAEVFYGVELLPEGKRRENLFADAEAMFTQDLAGQVFAFDSEAARVFSRVAAERRMLGKPISHADAQIAAIARSRSAKVATRNVEDFENCGIDVINPWNERSDDSG
jgi:predicted nucleic acid-binding protein